MAKKEEKPTFNVTAKLSVEVNINIEATSLADAVTKSSSLKIRDFITIDGEEWDSSLDIKGVWKS